MSYYPVYQYKENNNTPMSQAQVISLLSNPQTKIIDAVSGNQLMTPPGPNDYRPDDRHYHVANYYPVTREIVYHGNGMRTRW